MAEAGYARMSIERVAERAGTTKPTIYLRYPSKAALATAALAFARDRGEVRQSGDTRADLVLHLRRFERGVGRPFGMSMIGTVLTEEHHTPELLARFREDVVLPRRRLVRGVLERASLRGELRAEADLDAAVNMLIGSYYAGYLAGRQLGQSWAERVVDTVLAGLLATATLGRGSSAPEHG